MIALRYGTLPIVRETGGLRDTVLSYNKFTGEGNGFSFFNYNAHDMLHSVRRAVRYYREQPDVWRAMMRRGMEGGYSWGHSAGESLRLYEELIARKPAPIEAKAPKTKRAAPKVSKTAPVSPEIKAEEVKAAKKKTPARKPAAKKKPQ
jgi:starch synthase